MIEKSVQFMIEIQFMIAFFSPQNDHKLDTPLYILCKSKVSEINTIKNNSDRYPNKAKRYKKYIITNPRVILSCEIIRGLKRWYIGIYIFQHTTGSSLSLKTSFGLLRWKIQILWCSLENSTFFKLQRSENQNFWFSKSDIVLLASQNCNST